MKGFEKNKREIILLREAYANSNRRIREVNERIRFLSLDKYIMNARTIERIETAIGCLSGDERFIIENEVIWGREGKWFEPFYSPAAYYRYRRKAYRDFLRCL